MAGLDYRLIARCLHGRRLPDSDRLVPRISPLGLNWHRKVIPEYLRSSSNDGSAHLARYLHPQN